jgi:beta-glucosidase
MQTNILRAAALAAALCAGTAHAATYPFQDPNLAPQQRIANILALMTPDE